MQAVFLFRHTVLGIPSQAANEEQFATDVPGTYNGQFQQQQRQQQPSKQLDDDSFAEAGPAGLADEFGDSSEWVSAEFSFASPANGTQVNGWGLAPTYQPVAPQCSPRAYQSEQHEPSEEEWQYMQVCFPRPLFLHLSAA